ncbi:hypothetical protein [Haliangium ochraceum]|uniref:Uncharacterized protein n=1 Tax=Haliangium ochraceum (strain DSM 14365 / JCM 11303 / SMP-2) TaxID=502025 RepID=D0LVT1_HALO1|nr:hypothetical protein [Haliangium ochraceum]ACY14065.1 hypothetical protein Hoch_1513 [Haliangium ochraceum DSM 14365]
MNDTQHYEFHDLQQLQRRLARNEARTRLLFRGSLLVALLALLIWAPAALSEPDTPFGGVFDDMYYFSPNTPAVADEINSNFARLRSLDVENAEAIANLAVSPVNGNRLVNGTVANAHIANGSITANKLANDAVSSQVRDYIREKCFISIGWRDNCEGCSKTPSRFARHRVGRSSNGCDGGGGQFNCSNGWAAVGAAGKNVGDDQFYVRLECN